MNVQSFLNNFLDESNKTVLFATMVVVLVVLILLISLIRKRKKKKLEEKTAAAIDKAMSGDEDDLAQDNLVQDSGDSNDLAQDSSGSNTSAQDNIILDGRSDSTESRILTQGSNSGEEFGAHHPYDNFGSNYKDYDDDVEDIDNNDDAEYDYNPEEDAETTDNNDDAEALAQNTPAEEYNLYTNYNKGFNPDLNKDVEDNAKDVEDNAKDSENYPMEELLDEENDDIYNSDFVDGFFGTLAKDDSKESPESPKGPEESSESPKEPEESKEPPVELILHDQISVEENTPKEEKEKEAPEENKKAAITLVDGSDRVMVSVGEKFESRHKKEFTIDVTNEPEIKIALQDGFVFDGRVHFLVSFSEALAQHVSLKDVREIAECKGNYSGYEIQLEVTDKGDLETIDCTRTFNYKKIKDAVLIIQLSLE